MQQIIKQLCQLLYIWWARSRKCSYSFKRSTLKRKESRSNRSRCRFLFRFLSECSWFWVLAIIYVCIPHIIRDSGSAERSTRKVFKMSSARILVGVPLLLYLMGVALGVPVSTSSPATQKISPEIGVTAGKSDADSSTPTIENTSGLSEFEEECQFAWQRFLVSSLIA